MAAVVFVNSGAMVLAGDTSQGVTGTVTMVEENGDDVEIGRNDKPYLALGADLSEEQKSTVLSIMGISPEQLENYDVVYVTNAEEHQYLDAYISSAQIGSKAWSSIVIVEREEGSGLNISTTNINYCTVGMYKNALTTAGVTDADIIIAENDLSDEGEINEVIDEACRKYGVTLSAQERQQIVDLLLKITSLGIDLDGVVDYAKSLYDSYKNGDGMGNASSENGWLSKLFSGLKDWFSKLFG